MDNFLKVLFKWEFDLTKADTWIRVVCILTVYSLVRIFLFSLDGEGCGKGSSWTNPSSFGRPVGCFIRNMNQQIGGKEAIMNDTDYQSVIKQGR